MELYIYDRDMILHGVIDEINSLIWTRRYWSAGEFKLLVPFTSKHVSLLVKNKTLVCQIYLHVGGTNIIGSATIA